MNKTQQKRFDTFYQQHLNALKRQGKSDSTIDVYSRALRRITAFFDLCPDKLNEEHFKVYFDALVKSHSWSTVKVDRNGLQFFYRYVLNKEWKWIDIVKPPQVKRLPDILTQDEIAHLINHTRELRYQAYIFTVYSMGMRLGEALNLTIADIDASHNRIHVRNGKGGKDRFITMPEASLQALRQYWSTHRHPTLLFPNGKTPEQQHCADKTMNRGGLQKSFKAIVQSCGIRKDATIHSLRHCYGAHLVETGLNLRAIQHEMGHESPKTTALYTQITETVQQNSVALINQMIDQLEGSVKWIF